MKKQPQRQFIKITDEAYFALPAWSNTRLGDVLKHLKGEETQPTKPSRAFAFGSAVHGLILEDKEPDWSKFQKAERRDIEGIAAAAKANAALQAYLKDCQKEMTATWHKEGQPCKAKIDIMPVQANTILDLKTTRATTREEFLESCKEYNYDRQAAWYMEAAGAQNMIFVAFCKTAPYEMFTYHISTRSAFARQGKKRAAFLLNKALVINYPILKPQTETV
jgi:PDDEXK-like domain of unknown function (DUF3799)